MAGILVDYGSSSDSDIEVEDVAKPNSASHPLKNPGSPKVTSILSNAHSARSVVSPQDVAARKRRRPIKKSGPTLAEKRRMLMAAPDVLPDSDSDDDADSKRSNQPDNNDGGPKSFASLLPKPKNTRVSSTTIAAPAIAASTIQNQNMVTDKFMDAKATAGAASRPLVPHILSKKAKAEHKPKFFSSAADDDVHAMAPYEPSIMLPTVQSAPGAPSAAMSAALPEPTVPAAPAYGYGQPRNSAPTEPTTHSGAFGYGRGPVQMAPSAAGPAVVHTDGGAAVAEGAGVNIHSAEFQQLLGAQQRQQTKHGRKGDIKFVDVDQNARVGSFEEWKLKHGHEQAPMAHSSTSSQTYKTNSLSKRKHQITWLALQAKERQQELENSWAASSQAKKAARQRYGFH